MTSLIFEGLRITRKNGAVWVEGLSEPLSSANAKFISCHFVNEDGDTRSVIAIGPREYLEDHDEDHDAPLKIVTADDPDIEAIWRPNGA